MGVLGALVGLLALFLHVLYVESAAGSLCHRRSVLDGSKVGRDTPGATDTATSGPRRSRPARETRDSGGGIPEIVLQSGARGDAVPAGRAVDKRIRRD